jgi:hypothetical protein
MNRSISRARGVLSFSSPDAKNAIRPINVLSPVRTTRPLAVPAIALQNSSTAFVIELHVYGMIINKSDQITYYVNRTTDVA